MISETDFCRIAPDETRVCIRCGLVAGIEGACCSSVDSDAISLNFVGRGVASAWIGNCCCVGCARAMGAGDGLSAGETVEASGIVTSPSKSCLDAFGEVVVGSDAGVGSASTGAGEGARAAPCPSTLVSGDVSVRIGVAPVVMAAVDGDEGASCETRRRSFSSCRASACVGCSARPSRVFPTPSPRALVASSASSFTSAL